MAGWRRWLRNAAGSAAWWVLAWACSAQAAPADFIATRPTTEATRLVDWVLHTGDAHGLPFAVVDKRAARIYVFHADGRPWFTGRYDEMFGLSAGGDAILERDGKLGTWQRSGAPGLPLRFSCR